MDKLTIMDCLLLADKGDIKAENVFKDFVNGGYDKANGDQTIIKETILSNMATCLGNDKEKYDTLDILYAVFEAGRLTQQVIDEKTTAE